MDDVWAILKDLPNISHLSLEGLHVKQKLVPVFLDVCGGVKVLNIQSCKIQGYLMTRERIETDRFGPGQARRLLECDFSNSQTTKIESLTIGGHCEMDVVGFSGRCPHLKQLIIEKLFGEIYGVSLETEMEDLRMVIDSGMLPDLKDLEIVSNEGHIKVIPARIPCLRKYYADLALSSSPIFRVHFCVISEIWTSGPPGFWREVLSSCPQLRIAGGVNLSSFDVLDSKPWVCEKLELLFLECGEDSRKLDCSTEKALLQRISRLGKLKSLMINRREFRESGHDKNGLVTWKRVGK